MAIEAVVVNATGIAPPDVGRGYISDAQRSGSMEIGKPGVGDVASTYAISQFRLWERGFGATGVWGWYGRA